MLPRVLLALLLIPPLLLAEGPGVIVEGTMSQFAQDADGRVWGINDSGPTSIKMLVDSRWELQRMPELDSDCRPMVLEALEDGDVGCLWEIPGASDHTWIVTRHRKGQSRIAGRFQLALKEPAMQGLADGRVVITGAGRTFVILHPDARGPIACNIPESMFLPPEEKPDDTLSGDQVALHAVADRFGAIWLWAPEWPKQTRKWRVDGLLKVDADLSACHPAPVVTTAPPLSACVRWDETQLALAVMNYGAFLFNVATGHIEQMTVPDRDTFGFIQTFFHDGTAWYAVTTPKPTETQFSWTGALGRMGSTSIIYYDDTKPTCALWRQDAGAWKLVKNGLDKEPATHRPWLRTKSGLFLGTDSGPPWFFPASGGEARRICRGDTFPLRQVDHIFRVNDGQVLLASSHSDIGCLWPSDAPVLQEKPRRWEKFVTTQRALQDARGHIWCFKGVQSFVRWDGREWKTFPPPAIEAVHACLDFAPDDQDRGWLLHAHDAPTAICDFATGQWRSFPGVREALVAQLPKGVKLSLPEYTYCEHPFSGDGRIGAFMDTDTVWLYEQRRWSEWKFRDIAGPDAALGGTPFFAPDGKFSLPVDENAAWQWHGGSKGWQRMDGITVPHPGTGIDRETIELPEGTDHQGVGSDSAAKDRHGVIWFLRNKTELCKTVLGREVKVFDASELNPFARGGGIHKALADDSGNVLLDTTGFGSDHEQVFIRARFPVPDCSTRLVANADDTARIAIGGGEVAPPWHTWRVDGGEWRPLSEKREIEVAGLLPGKHIVEVRAFNDELTPSARTAAVSFVTIPAADARFAASLHGLAAPELNTREAAVRMLQSQGSPALPKLRAARESASSEVQWWIDAIIQHIERHATQPPSR